MLRLWTAASKQKRVRQIQDERRTSFESLPRILHQKRPRTATPSTALPVLLQ